MIDLKGDTNGCVLRDGKLIVLIISDSKLNPVQAVGSFVFDVINVDISTGKMGILTPSNTRHGDSCEDIPIETIGCKYVVACNLGRRDMNIWNVHIITPTSGTLSNRHVCIGW